jgi:hypothetical protein
MNIMKSTMLGHVHCAICPLWVNTTPIQDPAVSGHVHGPWLMAFLSFWYVGMALEGVAAGIRNSEPNCHTWLQSKHGE